MPKLILVTDLDQLPPAERWPRLIAPLAEELQFSGLGELLDSEKLRRQADQRGSVFVNDVGGFWHNKGNTRKYPIAFGFTSGSWFCLESTKRDDGKLLWMLAQGEPYLRSTFKGTTAELNKLLVDHLAGKGKLPEPVKEEPGFGPEYQAKK